MQLKRRVIMVGTTCFLAAATGHLMGGGSGWLGGGPAPKAPQQVAVAAIAPAAAIAPKAVPVAITPLAGRTNPDADLMRLVPAAKVPAAKMEKVPEVATRGETDPTTLPGQMAPNQIAPGQTAPSQTAAAPAQPDCTAGLSLAPAPAAMVELSLKAPCHANSRVVIRHSGLAVTALIAADGTLTTTIPALSQPAHIVVALADGTTAEGDISIPSLVDYDRVAVQWQGNDAFELHAFEFGADYADAGHVSAAHPRTPTAALQATGGFLTALGDGTVPLPMLAQVYTFPSSRSVTPGMVRLTIEAAVAPATCGRDMLGETLQAHAGQPVKVVDLTLAMPGCDASGDYVVLKNLLPDVMVAGN